jgi:hypothetical protein
MFRRLLNIASIACVVLCVALTGLWVRSYQAYDWLNAPLSRTQLLTITSWRGWLMFSKESFSEPSWNWDSWTPSEYAPYDEPQTWTIQSPFFKFHSTIDTQGNWLAAVPYPLLGVLTVAAAIGFGRKWPWRFSLRTAFIVATLLAVAMGAFVWLDRAYIGK